MDTKINLNNNNNTRVVINTVIMLLLLLRQQTLSLETKYFKRFNFGNWSMDLTDQLGERFNYNNNNNDYTNPPQITQPSNYHTTIHIKQSSSPLFHLHSNNPPNLLYMSNPSGDDDERGSSRNRNNGATSNSEGGSHSDRRGSELQGDQPRNNSDGVTNPTQSPTTTQQQPYKHQDLKALSKNITNILNSFNVSYDKRVRPNYGGEAVEVGITMFVLSISDLSEVEMDFTLDFYFRQMWKDHRLTFQGPKGVNTLSVSSEFLKSMWVPDTFFVNEKTSYFHTATTNNEFLRISQTGDILRSMRLTVCASCPMDLRHFPMDSQLCTIEIESFGYTMSDIRYKWAAGPVSVGMANDVSLPQFKVYGYRQKTYEISLSTGNYSRLACEIQFVRSMGYYLIQIYIPSSLIVVISWVSFWLNRNAAPARVYLGITTVLTMTTLMSSTNKALPKISYVKSIDVYLGTCFVMVFAALLEYATVGYLAKRIQMRKNHFAALQKMALQLQNAREEHVQKQYPQQQHQPIQQQQAPQPQLPPTTPSHHHTHHPHHHTHTHHAPHHSSTNPPTTPHTPRYTNPQQDYPTTPSSTRFLESTSTSTLRKYTNNNAQYVSTTTNPYNAQQQQQQQPQQILPPPQNPSIIPPGYYNRNNNTQQQQYDQARYYDNTTAQQNQPVYGHVSNSIPPPTAYASGQPTYYGGSNPQQQYYGRQEGWGESGGSCSRGASVKRRGNNNNNPDVGQQELGYPQQQQNLGGIPPSLLQQSLIAQQQQSVYGGQVIGGGQGSQFQSFGQSVVGSVIGGQNANNSASIEQGGQERGGPVSCGDKIRQLIPINPNQICGITPSDIDKYSRVVFPVCFVCFNLLYWIIYLHISNVNPTTDLVIVNADS